MIRLDIPSLLAGYRDGRLTPRDIVREIYARARAISGNPIWIHLIDEEHSLARAEALGTFREDLPLYGAPFAIKDNIDLAGVSTTAGCPAFAYTPSQSAFVVDRLIAAGAIPIGKTNLDQFATGLVGTRSPYGACSSVFSANYISGGSSSGSAVAVAAELVSFALGTDTAGSGRVPAAFNNIVGLKPTRGALSTSGVVPACRTLDCVSIFAKSTAEAARVLEVATAVDPNDPYSRAIGQQRAWSAGNFRFGVPPADQLEFFGDEEAPALFESACEALEKRGGHRVEIDYSIFREAAQLLYSGPWVAERLAAIRDFAAEKPDALHPVTGKIILGASKLSAVDTFLAMYKLSALSTAAQSVWKDTDLLLLPTAARHYTHQEIEADPIVLNTNLGYYTNFVNLLDLAAVAVPHGRRTNGLPFGVTVIGRAWSDATLLRTAALFEKDSATASPACPSGYVPLAVCGAHLSGQPLNWQLIQGGAFLLKACETSPEYRLYALKGTVPAKPGLVRVPGGGVRIEIEVWAVPLSTFGNFVAAVPPPLAIGSCTLDDGTQVKSFVCEPWAVSGAEDITKFGGWRVWLSNDKQLTAAT